MSNALITWPNTPPGPAQQAAWRELWARLLGVTGEQRKSEGLNEEGAPGVEPWGHSKTQCKECRNGNETPQAHATEITPNC